ncbi:MAG TPA: hypothetical protein VFK82_07405 [Burkholderiaceae bacterium]|nr:hypothetical protein [Burkholderiaceae bacterium]
MRSIRAVFSIASLLLLAACASPVPKIDSTPAALARVKTIAVIRAPEPKTYTVVNFGHPGMAFGLVGGLIAAGDQKSKQDELSAAMKQGNPALTSAALPEALVSQLNQMGFQARVEDAPWAEVDGKYTLPFDKINSDADAVVVVSPTIVGFIATGLTSDYYPTMTAVVTLLGKDRKEPLYRGYHATGWQPKADGWRFSPAKTTFGNYAALMADPKKSADALSEAARNVAASVARDLRI